MALAACRRIPTGVRKAEFPDYRAIALFIVGFLLYGISRIGIPMLQLYDFVGDSHRTGDFFHRACHHVSGPASRPPNQFVIAECGVAARSACQRQSESRVRSRPEITGGERRLRDNRQGSFMQNQEPG